ncbi:hypothetical protein EDI_066110 [Entamoeba dispar SAW760]|uniref:Uncharacterized protein n=1 Tax=Entamoeba dispar (strain ATCC PRA-260 / SAW760) TaxID=370354 RepID=B0EUM7_ENTDS|nr:uncharacterized protein EDI_066110 [Entamoeba dispar SAW760]EDR21766.1 hypothetical protein EDI_066110 [Entamoeba dispar SAW760]|eukprot:EDR21766.1 hypothetical protein EDI_066110 [Entamoeba dispar SAW760]
MDTEDKITSTSFENIKVNDLKNYFQDVSTLRDICEEFIDQFKNEHKYYLNEEKYDDLLENENRLIDTLYEVTSGIREEYGEIMDVFYKRSFEREHHRRMKVFKEIEKKPKQPKEEDKN